MAHDKLLEVQDIARHNVLDDCWVAIDGHVWDVSTFAPEHPGGAGLILRYAGKDATKAYSEVHGPDLIRRSLPDACYKGRLDPSTVWADEPVASEHLDVASNDERPPLDTILNSYDFEEVAARTAPPKAFAFYSTAATDCWTRDMNQSIYKRVWFRPRVLRDVTSVDTSTTILGNAVKLPLFICPTGFTKLIHNDAEKALASAAKTTGIIEIISTVCSYPVDQIVQQAPGHPFFLQLYVHRDRQKTADLLALAARSGIKAIFVTVDAAGRGKREADERLRLADGGDSDIVNPVSGQRVRNDRRGAGLTRSMAAHIDQGLSWADLAWLRAQTALPIVLKGVGCADDARRALRHDVQGLLLSNHGGRNLDFAPPALLLLLEMHKLCPEVFGRVEIYVDGGIRRGGDVVKALCLGATAVGIGRPFLYSLMYGAEGAEHLVELLKDEMESVMKLIGITDVSQCHPGLVNTSDVDHLVPSSLDHPYARQHPRPRL